MRRILPTKGFSGHPGAVHVDTGGKVSFRRAGRMQHLGVGYAHRGTAVLAIADHTTVTVIKLQTGEILSTHAIDPDRAYWRNTQRAPAAGRELSDCHTCRDSGVTHVSTHHMRACRDSNPKPSDP
jgi:hypothetical protein